jgi:hypothetical protein
MKGKRRDEEEHPEHQFDPGSSVEISGRLHTNLQENIVTVGFIDLTPCG